MHRWTGRADLLVGTTRRRVLTEATRVSDDPLDSLARAHGISLPTAVDPYADLIDSQRAILRPR